MRILKGMLAALLLFIPAAARADERILHYLSDVEVQKDSSIEVTETIDVRAENDRINHGIYRDFPTRYRGPNGTQFHVRFSFEGATLDGSPVKASVGPAGTGMRIKLGDPDSLVSVGEHEYVIHYRATREIGRFPKFDELYWNATGTEWIFPIDVAEARIRLPEPVKFGQRAVYTGAPGSTAHDAEVVDEKPGEIIFRTTQPLGPYQGLTVAAAFPKGIVAEPTSGNRALDFLSDYGPPALGLLSLIGLCAFYYVAWLTGRQEPPGRHRRADLHSSRRPQPRSNAIRNPHGVRQPDLRGRARRHGSPRTYPARRGRPRLVVGQAHATRKASRKGASVA